MKIWHIAALVGLGLAFDAWRPGQLGGLFQFAMLSVFLPALIFEAAWSLDLPTMRRAWKPIALLAVPGVAVTALVVAVGAHFLGGVALPIALVIGAVLSATDPIAVVAIFRRLNVPKELATIVESESLLNDAVAVVVYRAVLATVVATLSTTATLGVAGHAALGSVLGVLLGIGVGLIAIQALRLRGNVAVHTIATLVAAYGAYALAEHYAWSGIFAVIACGITMGEYERRNDAVTTADGVERLWSWLSTATNAALFFLIGASVALPDIAREWQPIVATLVAVALARIALAYGLLALAPPMLRSWKTVVQLAGVRGALALALTLALPPTLPDRIIAIDATFAVVILTIVIGALSTGRQIDRMRLE
jgi:CPA1 family monovalent cation:H+ antiporter